MKKEESIETEKILFQIDEIIRVLPLEYYTAITYMIENHEGFKLLMTIANNDYQQKKATHWE